MKALTARQAILRRYAGRSLIVALLAVRVALVVHRVTGWLYDRLEALSQRQQQHAADLTALSGLAPVPVRIRRR